MARKKLPDNLNKSSILDALQKIEIKPVEMTSPDKTTTTEQADNFPTKEETDENLFKRNPTPLSESTVIKTKSISVAPQKNKTKVNFYLTSTVKRRIEKVQTALREIVPADDAGQVNYSMIVEAALNIVINDFERTREESLLSREIFNQLQNK